jgi:uncharacterized protein YyaL (SSP411 family)
MSNRLSGATSPYLRQHAENPVDWYPWGDEALALARRDNKPILLSIGYSACHWCHVMAHESFEDPAIAAAMNERYVNIKVDREERPDLDQIYQTAHALLTRRTGGWPLTVLLTPSGAVLCRYVLPEGGTYGLPGFIDIPPRIANAYCEQGGAIAEQNRNLAEAMASLEPVAPAGAPLPGRAPGVALAELKRNFDRAHGGFGGAPKFPHPAELEFCLRAYGMAGDGEALAIVNTTLTRMAQGGIQDQLGGGFYRYSVDAEWTIPHFEKMLYDNGPLLSLYADLARAKGEAAFGDVARGIVGWLTREMRLQDGAFYSSQTPTAKARKASSTFGQPTRRAACLSPRSGRLRHPISAWTSRRISNITRGICALRNPSRVSRNGCRSPSPTRRRGSSVPGRRCSRRAKSACAPVSTTRS